MPLWTVEGADKQSGKDTIRSIDAPTEVIARQTAEQMGILVAEIHRSTADPLEELHAAVQASQSNATATTSGAPTLNYSTVKKNPTVPDIPIATPAPPVVDYPTTPEYRDILVGAKWLRIIALFAAIIGWIGLGVAALSLVLGIVETFAGSSMLPIAIGLPFVIPALIFGVGYLALAAILRLAASVAVAVRDMARNSFTK